MHQLHIAHPFVYSVVMNILGKGYSTLSFFFSELNLILLADNHFSLLFRYASLYFCAAVDPDDNELITLEVIHRYVELLDKYFGSVCWRCACIINIIIIPVGL